MQIEIEDQKAIDSSYKRQLLYYATALGILACLFVGGYNFEARALSKQEDYAEIINLSGRQRMLSQQIVARVLEYKIEVDNDTKLDHLLFDLELLNVSLETFSNYQIRFLLDQSNPASLADLNNEKTAKLYLDGLGNIALFMAQTKKFIENSGQKKIHEKLNIKALSELAEKISHLGQGSVLTILDALTLERAKQAKVALEELRRSQKVLFLLFLIALVLEALFLFIPEVRRRREAMVHLFYLHKKEKELLGFSALGEISAKIVHEINNPLSVVIGRIDILQKNRDKIFDEKTLKIFESMKQNLLRISKIIKLTKIIYRKGDNDAMTIFDLSNIVSDIVETTQFLKERGTIKFSCNLEKGHFIKAQEHQVFQVINNIVGNAIDATLNQAERIVYIELSADDISTILRISDNGPGVQLGLEEKIFEKLFTTKKSGTGIGLFESRQIIRSHGGSIVLAGAISRSCFEIRIPLSK